jgi:benzoyl-CoA reductase/2-hydroxyglutaryl-CoA dehydratase subunit BcrC/BadD/HgdB
MLAVKRAVSEWKCDGAIIYNNKSCKPYSTGNRLKAKMLIEWGIPTLVLEVDHTDPSGYSPEHARGQVEVFLEMMEEKK